MRPSLAIIHRFRYGVYGQSLLIYVEIEAMETSIEIKVWIIIAVGAVLSAYAISWRATSKTRQMVAWIEATYPEIWNALPRYHRNWLKGAAIEGLRHRGVINDS